MDICKVSEVETPFTFWSKILTVSKLRGIKNRLKLWTRFDKPKVFVIPVY
jgi:hypothetical protein